MMLMLLIMAYDRERNCFYVHSEGVFDVRNRLGHVSGTLVMRIIRMLLPVALEMR